MLVNEPHRNILTPSGRTPSGRTPSGRAPRSRADIRKQSMVLKGTTSKISGHNNHSNFSTQMIIEDGGTAEVESGN